MKFKSILSSLFLFVLTALTPVMLLAEPYQQEAMTGLVSIEAEHADANIARGGYSWVANFTSGYSADSGLQASPTWGNAQKDPGYSLTSPQLDYQVNFVETGTHYVWVRGIGDRSSRNSVHVGLDGNEVATSEALNFRLGTSWAWHGGVGVATIEITSPGVHTVNVWMREAGFRIDKLVLTKQAGFTPSGTSPLESPRGSGGGGANQMPVAVAGGPYSGLEGELISFDGSGSFDLDGDSLGYSWDFGDGSALGSGVAPSHSYATANSYTVTLTVNDGSLDSLTSTATAMVNLPGVNQAPVADAGGPYNGLTGNPVTFNGSGSSDPDGDPLTSYSWDFGDGSAPGSGVSPSHSYATADSYTVTLTVNDGSLDSTPSTATVTVNDGSGTPAFQQEATTGLVSIEAEHADANIARGGYSWVANFTSGYSADSGLQASPTWGNAQKDPGYSLASPQLDYQVNFVETGTHYVWVRGIGDRSSRNSVHVGLDGNEVATSEALNFRLGTSWAWHGGVGVATIEITSPGVHTVNVWMREAGFRIDKLVLTKQAGFTPSGTSPLESPRGSGGGGANQMPVAVAGGPYSGLEGELISFDGSGSFDLDGDSLGYSWDFGDGSALGSGVAPSHSYATANSYTVTLTVNDGSLDSLTSTATAMVNLPGVNQAPVADAGGPYNGLTGNPVTFNGSGSSDPDGDPLTSYSWDFGDGSAPGSGVSPSHSYATADSYTVTLTVNDGSLDSTPSTATVTVNDGSGTPAFQQEATTGLVSIEAEHADANIARGGYSWVANFTSGYSADSGLQASPTWGNAQKDPGYSLASPQLDYQVNFVETGTHYVWVRGIGDRSSRNSVHVGLDGNEVATSEALNFRLGTSWAWHGGVGVATIEITSPGVHTVNVWMREAGFRIDKLVLTKQAGFTPSGTSPLESPRGSGGPAALFEDDFNDGNSLGWSVVDECVSGSSSWSIVSNAFMQRGECRGFSPEGVAIASHAVSNVSLPANVDIRLRINSQDPETDAVTTNNGSRWKFHTIGVMFGYQNSNNYYRFELNGMKGHRKLWRKQSGVYTELNTSPQSFNRGQWHDIRIVHQNNVILIFVNGLQVMAVKDATFSSGPLALFCARNTSCNFDDIVVTDAPVDQMVGLQISEDAGHAYGEYFVDTDDVIDVSAVTTVSTGVGGIEFVIDEGTGSVDEDSWIDQVAPYTARFASLITHDHTVTAYLLDGNLNRLTTAGASATLVQIGSSGIRLYAVGDSISNGLEDDIALDDVSQDGRNTGGGYEPLLNNFLRRKINNVPVNNGVPVSVLNDGNNGEESWEGAARIDEILSRTPEVQAYLVFYGANDSGGSQPRDPGLNLKSGQTGYAGSFKDYIQQIIDAVLLKGKMIILAKAPPYLASSTRNALVVQYNEVIDQLIMENSLGYVAPDLYSYFITNQSEYNVDGIHPNGTGYQSMSGIMCQGINGILGLTCIP